MTSLATAPSQGTSALPTPISQIIAADGVVCVRAAVSRREDLPPIRQGDLTLEFAASNGARMRRELIDDAAIRNARLDATIGTTPRLTLNEKDEWTLSGARTMFIRLDEVKPGDAFSIGFGGHEAIALEPQAYKFKAYLAAHRLRGRLHLAVRDFAGALLHTAVQTITPVHGGGKNPMSHLRVSIDLPAQPVPTRLTVGFLVDDVEFVEDLPRYLFLSAPALSAAAGVEGPVPLLLENGTEEGERFDGQIDPYGSDELWVAEVPLATAVRRAATISGGRLDGRVWAARASSAGTFTLYVDGAYAAEAHLGPDSSGVEIPWRYLDGAVHHLALRDRHGLFVLYEDYLVLPSAMTPQSVLQRESRRPFPHQLSPQASFRYRALAAALGSVATSEEARTLAHAHHVLEVGFEAFGDQHVGPLEFEEHEQPDVSVIIPVHNKFAVTYHCLCALLLARSNRLSAEIVVVDDGSSDETTRLDRHVRGIRIVRTETPQRFIRACNAGVAQSRGRYVAIINNDIEPTLGWLDELVEPFERFEDVGLTGAKLLFPDGRLQEAGGIVWRSGNPWNYGRGANPWEPRFSYTRQTDYVTGAAMLTTRSLWDELGGFSDYLEPMYFEDTDFAFKVREAGRKVMFAPLSIVFHHEGITSGTDITAGMKASQEVNRPKFKNRWAKAFRQFGADNGDPDFEKDRGIVGRVAFIDMETPRPDRDAGSYAAVEEMKLVQSLGFKVTFVPDNLAHLGSYTDDLARQGIEVVTGPFCLSVAEFIEKRGTEFDAFYLFRYAVGGRHIDTIRRYAPRAKILFMNVDLHFLRELRRDLGRRETVNAIREQELEVVRKADVTLCYSEVEQSVILSHTLDSGTVVKAPWVERPVADVAPLAGRDGMAFLGSYRHPPNAEAVRWFLANVMPALRRSLPEAVFHVYGSSMPDDIKALAGEGVETPGYVEDIREIYDRHRIFVAPLLHGAGLKGKVLGALAHGIPCVLSPVAAEGVGLRSGYDCVIAETPQDWTDAIERLTRDEAFWRQLSDNGLELIRSQHSFARGREKMREAFNAAGIYHML